MCSNLLLFIWERVGYLINVVFFIDVCMRNNKKKYNVCVNKNTLFYDILLKNCRIRYREKRVVYKF